MSVTLSRYSDLIEAVVMIVGIAFIFLIAWVTTP